MSARTIEQAQCAIVDQFELFEDWTDRYQMLISMGRKTQHFPQAKQTDAHLIKGCQAQVWFDIWVENGRMRFCGTSDAAIVSGLIALLMQIYDDQTPADILATPPHFIQDLGFEGHLSPTRQSGLYAMLKALKIRARQVLEEKI